MSLPVGHIAHSSSKRLRIRVPEERNNFIFFEQIQKAFQDYPGASDCRVSVPTGSILFSDTLPDIKELSAYVQAKELFRLAPSMQTAKPLKKQIYGLFSSVNHQVEEVSGDVVDLPILVFLTLVGTGIVQVLRAEVGLPPWYTAFWYALGVFTKSLTNKNELID